MPQKQFSNKFRLTITIAGVLVMWIVLCLYGIFVVSSAFRNPSADCTGAARNSTLELLHVVFRHGPRTPADTYPNDPYINEKFFPFGWGQITNNGKVELFNIGTWLRKRYNCFLGPFYQPDDVHAQATGVTRTHMSMATVLASLFPPKNTPMEWNSKYNWQPIPIFSQTLDEDNFLLVRKPCPRYYEALNEVFQLPQVKSELEPYRNLFEELTEITGMNISSPEHVQSLFTTLIAEDEFGLDIPQWMKQYYPHKMKFLAEKSYIYNVYTPEMKRLKAGPFLSKMLTEMQEKRDNKLKPEQRKLFIYAGHDSTVVNILAALNVWEMQMPQYSVMTIFELHKDKSSGKHYVKIYFKKTPKHALEKLTIPGCDFHCPLDKLINHVRNSVLQGDLQDACVAKDPGFIAPPPNGP